MSRMCHSLKKKKVMLGVPHLTLKFACEIVHPLPSLEESLVLSFVHIQIQGVVLDCGSTNSDM